MTSLQEKWAVSLDLLKEEITETKMNQWILPLKPVKFDKKEMVLYVESDNDFVIRTIKNRYLQLLEGAVSAAYTAPVSVVPSVTEKKIIKKKNSSDEAQIIDDGLSGENYLNPRYNFNNFVVGKNNEFAYSAARAVAEAPAEQYNPLFLYGSSGLGKTHLMHAIGHYILKNSDKKVLYISSETFTSELVASIRKNAVGKFKQKYRNIDVLLIDDIQFIEGKDSSQEEFFHTFNILYDNNKQIIISSDRPPQQLTRLDERLTSRFLWSVTADLQPPDFETRVAILMNKAEQEKVRNIDPEVVSMIAENIKYNVREMEGALTRVIAFSELRGEPINVSLAKEVLKDIINMPDYRYSINSIKKAVSKYYGISIKDLDSSGRSRKISYPRQIAMYLIKELTDNSLPKIGEAFGGRDHTTVLYAYKKIKEEIENDNNFKTQIEEIKANLE